MCNVPKNKRREPDYSSNRVKNRYNTNMHGIHLQVAWQDMMESTDGYVAAWVYDSIIYSGVNRRGRDVHCIVGVLGKSSHTL